MIISGSYAIWYARWELAVYSGDLSTDVIIDTGERRRLKAITFIENVGAVRSGVMLLIAVAATIGISQIENRASVATRDHRREVAPFALPQPAPGMKQGSAELLETLGDTPRWRAHPVRTARRGCRGPATMSFLQCRCGRTARRRRR